MTIQCEELEYCKVKVSYIADSDLINRKTDEVVRQLKKQNPRVPGFRQNSQDKTIKGKKKNKNNKKNLKFKNYSAFDVALKKQYGEHIKKQVIQELVSEGIDETIFETKIKPIGYPNVTSVEFDGNTFGCELVFFKKPEFELKQYKDFEIPKPHLPETVESLTEKTLQDLRVKHGDVVPYGDNDFVQPGDQLSADIKAFDGIEPIPALTKEGLLYTVGENTYEELDLNMYGMKAGDSRTFDIVFPNEENIDVSVRGKRIKFEVLVHMGTKRTPCALDDDLAQQVGVKTFEELRQNIVGLVTNKLASQERVLITQQVMNRLVDNHQFEVPLWFVLMESQQIAKNMGQDWEKLSDEDKKILNEGAKKNIRVSMILDSIRDAEPESVFTEQEVLNNLVKTLSNSGRDPNAILPKMEKDGSLIGTVAKLRDEATVQWIINNSKIVE